MFQFFRKLPPIILRGELSTIAFVDERHYKHLKVIPFKKASSDELLATLPRDNAKESWILNTSLPQLFLIFAALFFLAFAIPLESAFP